MSLDINATTMNNVLDSKVAAIAKPYIETPIAKRPTLTNVLLRNLVSRYPIIGEANMTDIE